MPIKNYTTDVDVYKTLGTIQADLVKHGAKKIVQDYDRIIRSIKQFSAADVEEVVHCKDCAACSPVRHWRTGELTYYLCNRTDFVVSADGFCNFGRRRTNNG